MRYLPQSFRIVVAGFTISFIGTLPFGVLNVLAFFIALTESLRDAALFSLGVVTVELIYVALTLYGASRLRLNATSGRVINMVMVAVVLLVAFMSLQDAFSGKPLRPAIPKEIPRFVLGLSLSAVNALQIPFWLGWNALLIEKKLLNTTSVTVIQYLVGIGIGTLSGLLVFACTALVAGEHAVLYLKEIKLCIACVLIATACFMAYKLIVGRHVINPVPTDNPTILH